MYVGSLEAAANVEKLNEHGITHVLNAAGKVLFAGYPDV